MFDYNNDNNYSDNTTYNFTIIKLNDDDCNISKSLEDEVNEGIDRLKKQSWKYYFYSLFCCNK